MAHTNRPPCAHFIANPYLSDNFCSKFKNAYQPVGNGLGIQNPYIRCWIEFSGANLSDPNTHAELFQQCRAGALYPRLPHASSIFVGVVPAAPVQQATVIPDNEVVWLPVVRIDMIWLGCIRQQIVQELPTFRVIPSYYFSCMGTNIEIWRVSSRIAPDKFLLNRR